MKNKFLLPALFLAAGFTACTQEDLVENNATGMDEVVGAKLLGTGFVANLDNEAETRVVIEDGVAKWEKGDKAAVAWAVAGKVADEQKESNENLYKTLYANHMLVHDGAKFNSNSNVYEGWHFSYAPYKRMAKPSIYGFDINVPLTEADLKIDQLENAPMFSNRAFVSTNQVNDDGMVLVTFPLQRIVNTIKPELHVASEFTGSKLLNILAIDKVTLDAGVNKLFTNTLQVNPAGLKKLYDAENKLNIIDETYFGTFGSGKAFELPEGADYVTSISTEVANAETYSLKNEVNTVRLFLAPTQDASAIDTKNNPLSIRIDVEGGFFLINAKDKAATNVESLNVILGMLQGTYEQTNAAGKTHKFDLTKANQPNKTLQFELTTDNFYPDYTISDIKDWVACVNIATALGTDNLEFYLEEGANVVFGGEGVEVDGKKINGLDANGKMIAPANGVKVICSTENDAEGAKLVIDGDSVEWNNAINVPADYKKLSVTVNKDKVLSVKSTEENQFALQPYRLWNYGTITVDKWSTVGRENYSSLQNASGRVEIEYGAYVYPAEGKEGTIAFRVQKETTVKQLKRLIEGGENAGGEANVNTLIVDGITLEPADENDSPIDGDRYEGDDVEKGAKFPDLDEVDIELYNGGQLISDNVVSARTVTITNEEGNEAKENVVTNINILKGLAISGNATVTNESIAGGVDVQNADVNITTGEIEGGLTVISKINSKVTVTGNIEGNVVAANASVEADNIVGTVEAKPATITANTITGNVTASGETIINNADMAANLTVAEGADVDLNKVNVAGTFENNGTVTLDNEVAANVKNLVNNGTLTSDVDLNVTTVALNPKSVTTLSSNGVDYDMTIWYTGSYTFKNMTLNGTVKQYGSTELVEALQDGGDVTLKGNVTLSDAITLTKATNIDLNGYTLTTSTSEGTGDDITISAGVKLTVQGGKVETSQTAFFNNGGELTLTNCEIVANNSGATAVSSNGGKMNITGGSIKCLEDVQSDYYVVAYRNGAQGTINTTVEGKKMGALTVIDKANVTVSGGTYTAGRFYGLYVGGATANYNMENTEFSGVEAEKDICVDDTTYGPSTINNESVSDTKFYADTVNN